MTMRAPSRRAPTFWLSADGADRTLRSRLPVFTVTVAESGSAADSGAAPTTGAPASRTDATARTTSGARRRFISPVVCTASLSDTGAGNDRGRTADLLGGETLFAA